MKKNIYRILVLLTFVFPAFLETSCQPGGKKSANIPETDTVYINQMKFMPAQLSIHPGDTVVWINRGIAIHTATDSLKAWDSGAIPVGKSWKTTPKKSSHYSCIYHPTMKGEIIVLDK